MEETIIFTIVSFSPLSKPAQGRLDHKNRDGHRHD
jgi:hypothetical protein